MKLYLLLYADDTVILAESEKELQKAIDSLKEYCTCNKLHINSSKSKIMIFSRGKLRNRPIIKFGDATLEVVDEYLYLGILFNYNGTFTKAIKRLRDIANKAMFSILSKGRKYGLDIDTQLHLFNAVVTPILLYGCEVWGFSDLKPVEKVILRFCKMILKVKSSTPTAMVRGELGILPLEIEIKTRMITYWSKILKGNHDKYTFHLYQLSLELNHSKWIKAIREILDNSGNTYIWLSQAADINQCWLKHAIRQTYKDHFIQQWNAVISNSSKCSTYQTYKKDFQFENYLINLPIKYRIILTKFRCRSHRLPIEEGIFRNIPKENRYCTLCNTNEIGDELHYLTICPAFASDRKIYLPVYDNGISPNQYLKQLFELKDDHLIKTCQFISKVFQKFSK